MGSEPQHQKQQRQILLAYGMLLLTVFTVLPIVLAYVLSYRVMQAPDVEVWLQSHAIWISRHVLIFAAVTLFAGLWFVPLAFVAWNSHLWVTATTIVGVVLLAIAWLLLLHGLLQGCIRYWQRKPVY